MNNHNHAIRQHEQRQQPMETVTTHTQNQPRPQVDNQVDNQMGSNATMQNFATSTDAAEKTLKLTAADLAQPRSPCWMLSKWLETLFLDIERARSIAVPEAVQDFFAEELARQQFGEHQARTARAWILFGNWQFRGRNATLMLSDFFPTREQIDSLSGGDVTVLTRAEYRIAVRESYQRGFASGRDEATATLVKEVQGLDAARRLSAQAFRANIILRDENEVLKRKTLFINLLTECYGVEPQKVTPSEFYRLSNEYVWRLVRDEAFYRRAVAATNNFLGIISEENDND